MLKKKILKKFLLFVFIIITIELGLSFIVGIGERPLYMADTDFEYCLKSNQDIYRFHNNFLTNGYGMRAKPVSKFDKKRILLFGDSVLNGGTELDQSEIINYCLENEIKSSGFDSISVYAASAGSWGVENQYRYMLSKIDFKFDCVILITNTHDYYDNMHHQKVVGIHPAWPSEQPMFAITDLVQNAVIPKVKSLLGINNYSYLDGIVDTTVTPGILNFKKYCNANNIPLIVYHHPEKTEVLNRSYSEKGQKLINYFNENMIHYVEGVQYENSVGYIDNVHLNSDGHLRIAKKLYLELKKINLF